MLCRCRLALSWSLTQRCSICRGYPPVPKIHQVQAGDTLIGLAERYGLDAQELQLVNGFTDETVLQLGMTVYIPNQTGDLFARNYAVQIGDTVERIAGSV